MEQVYNFSFPSHKQLGTSYIKFENEKICFHKLVFFERFYKLFTYCKFAESVEQRLRVTGMHAQYIPVQLVLIFKIFSKFPNMRFVCSEKMCRRKDFFFSYIGTSTCGVRGGAIVKSKGETL